MNKIIITLILLLLLITYLLQKKNFIINIQPNHKNNFKNFNFLENNQEHYEIERLNNNSNI